jgi:hypothetical protein
MPMTFSHSTRALQADTGHRALTTVLVTLLLLGLWSVWFGLARVPIYETTATAQLINANRARALFPINALSRIQPGQPAQLHLDNYPSTQFGHLPATVTSLHRRSQEDQVQVELTLLPALANSLPRQPGLTGVARIEVERVTPLTLMLRAAGQRLSVNHSDSDALAETGDFE